ncbi:MAG TPA: saccharopine dehydrogenase C-terminal domain-containing protein [Chitinophagaceae bacterium]|nr:saccharopine dehydrogenase C-terminal domain-containing protein [Chitinophagaceae bacterium]
MVTVLIIGAGKSSSYLIETLLQYTIKKSGAWHVILADADEATLKRKTEKYPLAEIAVLDITNQAQRQKLVKRADIVLSLMPAHLHILLAKDCLEFEKNLITSSYASDEMKELDQKAKEKGLMFMCEMGLDPGIDHMTASHIFDSIRKVSSDILSFKSYCGGLIAPESDDNPWHYKFSWNPQNVINAGKDGATFLKNGKEVRIGYEQVFEHTSTIHCEQVGKLAYYANRDSLPYIQLYDVPEAKDFLRATLRYPAFIKGWNGLIRMGLTDNNEEFDTDRLTYKDWMQQLIGYNDSSVSPEAFAWNKYDIKSLPVQKMIEWLDLFTDRHIGKGRLSSAAILLDILSRKWKMEPSDKDMVVMQHEIQYRYRGNVNNLVTSMVTIGANSEFSAMARTVGMPMAILAELVLSKNIRIPTGVVIPTMPEVYRPVLNRLRKYGIAFEDIISA